MAALGRRTGEDDHLGVGIIGHPAHGFVEGPDELAVQGVAACRAIQGDGPDAVHDLGQDHGVGVVGRSVLSRLPRSPHFAFLGLIQYTLKP